MEWENICLDSIDSTNAWAKKKYPQFDPKKITVITAEEQTQGLGRCQRCWLSPQGEGIYTTFYFQLPIHILHLSSLGHLLCYSLAQVLISENFSPKIKWPNDILLNEKKVAGVLCETLFSKDHIDIFLGIGINISTSQEVLDKIDQPATSLFLETHQIWDKNNILKNLEIQFMNNLEIFKKEGFYPFHAPYENLLAHKGETITCYDGQKKYTGILHSITCDGGLNLLLSDHTMKTFLAGDINFKQK